MRGNRMGGNGKKEMTRKKGGRGERLEEKVGRRRVRRNRRKGGEMARKKWGGECEEEGGKMRRSRGRNGKDEERRKWEGDGE